MNGDDLSSRVEARLGEYADAVEREAVARGLPAPEGRPIDHHLALTHADMLALSDVDLAGAAYDVACYAYYLRDQANRHRVLANKCLRELKKRLGRQVDDFPGHRFDDRLLLAAQGDDLARALQGHLEFHQDQLARWEGLDVRLSDVSRRLDGISYRRRRQRHG